MAAMHSFIVAVLLVGWATAYPPMYNRQFTSQFPRIFQAACLVTNATSGEELQNEECSCGDETVACDVGPVTHYGMEMTFCNKLDDQSEDQLYVLQFACVSGEDDNCGTGTLCDIGPFTYEDTEYFLCRFASSVTDDTEDMCKPDITFTQPPSWGMGSQRVRGGRWAAFGSQGNVPANPPQNLPNNGQQWTPGMGMRWNQAQQGVNPDNTQVNTWGQPMGSGRRWTQGVASAPGSNQQMPAGGAQTWGQQMPTGGAQTWGQGMQTGGSRKSRRGGQSRGGQSRGGQSRGGQSRQGRRTW